MISVGCTEGVWYVCVNGEIKVPSPDAYRTEVQELVISCLYGLLIRWVTAGYKLGLERAK